MNRFSALLTFSIVLVNLITVTSATLCSNSDQCADNQVCFNGRCQCEMGYFGLPNGFGVDCNHQDCGEESDQDRQCSAAFGQHSTCSFVEGQPRCVCTEGSVWNPATERCQVVQVTRTSQCSRIGHHCHFPVGSFCGADHHCRCRLSEEPRVLPTFTDSLFKVICVPRRCSTDWQCWEIYGKYGSKCSSPVGICESAR